MTDEKRDISTVREDLRFQRIFWRVERVAWILLACIPLAALVGLFAHGYLSDKVVRAADRSLVVEYERFQRESVQSRYVFRIRPAETETRLRLNAAFQHSYDIQGMQPAPARARADADGLDLYFHAPENGQLVVVIWCTPRQFGRLGLAAQADSGDQVQFPIFIYP